MRGEGDVKGLIIASVFVMLLLFSSIPADSVLRNVVSTPDIYGVSASEDTTLGSVRKLVGDLEEVGFGNALDGLIDKILSLNRVVFLFFYADWCHFCMKERPIIDELEPLYSDKIVFIHLNSSKNSEAMDEFAVTGFPAMFLIYGKSGDGYAYRDLSGFQEKLFLQDVFDMVANGNLSTLNLSSLDEDFGNSSCFPHHSCSLSKCLKNCVKEALGDLSLAKVLYELGDFLKSCAGLKAAEALEAAFKAAKAGICAADCKEVEQDITGGHADAQDIGTCVRCALARLGALPGAGCPISLADKLAKLLAPAADCLAECSAPPSTWKEEYGVGHECLDAHTPAQDVCVDGSTKGMRTCIDCEWYLSQGSIEKCPMDAPDCVETSSGAKCQNRCTKLNCDDGDPCTWDWCDYKVGCKHYRTPGCDKPDDNYGVSDYYVDTYNISAPEPRVGVLLNGFAPFILDLLARLGIPAARVETTLEGIEEYPVLILPSGAISGFDSSYTFRTRLEQYADQGGTLLVFAQQNGYEYQALPGHALSGYGWLEDISCQLDSSAISTYHPMFASQHSTVLDLNVDGFFTSISRNSSILLTRTKNEMPVMIMYSFGAGRVIASTLYSDMASALYLETSDEETLIKELVTWAIEAQDSPTFQLGTANVSIPVENPYLSPLEYPVQEFNIGDTVNLSFALNNGADVPTDLVSFLLYDPLGNKFTVNVSRNIPVNQSATVALNYPTTNLSSAGMWSIYYLLSASSSPVYLAYAGEFALGYSISEHSQFDAYVTVFDPDQNIVQEQNFSLYILPGQTGSINLTVNADKYGLWTARYSVLTRNDTVVFSEKYIFAVSGFRESSNGFAYFDSQLVFNMTSESREYVYGKDASFTVTVKNEAAADKSVIGKWMLPNPSSQTVIVPAGGTANFTISSPVYESGRLIVRFYDSTAPGKLLGEVASPFEVYHPDVNLGLELDKPWYREGETVTISVNLENLQPLDYSPQTTVRVFDPNGVKVFESAFYTEYLPKFSSTNKMLTFTLPLGSSFGTYTLTSEAYSGTEKIGGIVLYFDIPKLPVSVRFSEPWFRVRENLDFEILLRNYLPTRWSQTVNIAVSDLSFSDSISLCLEAGSTKLFSYSLPLLESLQPGKHLLVVKYVEENTMTEFSFFIAQAKLQHRSDKTTYIAGETVNLTLENTGGVDADYAFHATLVDTHLQTVVDQTWSGILRPGENTILAFPIPTGATKGIYYLWRQAENTGNNEVSTASDILIVDGSEASLTSETNEKVYSIDEVITILSHIFASNQNITNAVLNLQISAMRQCVVPQDNLYITEDTVLCSGTYYVDDVGLDGVLIVGADGVTLEGNNTIIVQTDPAKQAIGARIEGFNGVNVRGIEFKEFAAGIYLSDSNNSLIENNVMNTTGHPWAEGIALDNYSTNNVIRGNWISLPNFRQGTAISLTSSMDNTISGNNATNSNEGVYLSLSTGNTIANNFFCNNDDGVWLDNSANNNIIASNTVNNNNVGIDIESASQGNIIANNTANNNGEGIAVYFASNNVITGNVARNCSGAAFYFDSSGGNTISNNIADSSGYGFELYYGTMNVLSNNTMTANTYGFLIDSDYLIDFVQNIDTSNTIDGRPIYYLVGVSDVVVDASTNAGFVAVVNSFNVTVRDLTLTKNGRSVVFANATNSIIENITANNNTQNGISLYFSNNNTINNNRLNESRYLGIYVYNSDNNTFSSNIVGFHSYYGIVLTDSSFNTVFNNSVFMSKSSYYGYGINIERGNNNGIINNEIYSNIYGILVHSSLDNRITGNNVSSNVYGIQVGLSDGNVINDNVVSNFGSVGISLSYSDGNTIARNHADSNPAAEYSGDTGITLGSSIGNNLSDNTANWNKYGIRLNTAGSNKLTNNEMNGNTYNFVAEGSSYTDYNNDVDTSNLVNGKPIYYLIGVSNVVLDSSSNAGTVYCINCVKVTIKDLNLTGNGAGIYFYNTTDSTIQNNTMSHNLYGAYFSYSRQINVLENNAIDNSRDGISFSNSDANQVSNNNASGNSGNGISFSNSNTNQVSNNTANSNANGAGITLAGSNSSSISNNTANLNYHGIGLSSSSSNNVTRNNVAQNRMGIALFYAATTNNVLLENIACSNEFDILTAWNPSANSGFNNTCASIQNWNDNGATGCTYTCGGSGLTSCADSSSVEPTLASPLPQPVSPIAIAPNIETTTLTHRTVGSHAWHQSDINTLIAQSQFQKGRGSVLWDKNITVDLTNIPTDIPTYVGMLNVTGKLYLYATLYSVTGQIIATSVYPFYIADKTLAITVETDKAVYLPGETVNITGSVINNAEATNATLTVTADGAVVLTQDFYLTANSTSQFNASIVANATFILEASVNETIVSNYVIVATPQVDANIIAPDTASRDQFGITISLRNSGLIPVSLRVTMDADIWTVNIAKGQVVYLKTSKTITEDTVITANITGDINQTLQKNVIFGEKASIQINPESAYTEGAVAIPYKITSTGSLETRFNATFSVNGFTIVKEIYVAAGDSLSDVLVLDLPKGMFVLQIASPFWSAHTSINVQSGPDFIVKSMPDNLVFRLGDTANITVEVKNIGGKEGELKIDLQSPGLFEEHYQAWVDSGQELNVTFSSLIPEDLAENNYTVYAKVDGKTYEAHFLVQGIKLAISAALDKRLQVQGDIGVFTLSIQNLQGFEVTLFSRVKLGDYDNVTSFSLAASETKTLEFSVPITFDAGKLLYSVYSSSGRSVYINSTYIIQKPPESAGIILYADKEVYESGETATIYVTTTKAGTLVAAGPGLSINTTLEATSNTFTFVVPLVRTGEYSIDYSYGEFSTSYPIDIIGYTARITNSTTDKQDYRTTDVVKLNATVDVNRPFLGQVQVSILDMNNTIVGETASNHTFTAGENALSLNVPINTTLTGQHYALLKTYAFGSYIFLVSSARYFDVIEAADTTPPTISYVDVTNGFDSSRPFTENEPIDIHAIVSDNVNVTQVSLYYRKAGEQNYVRMEMTKCPSCIDTYNATIPASEVSTPTIEYYVNATDGTNFATNPSANPTTNPHIISVNMHPTPVTLSNPTSITESSMQLNWTQNTDDDFGNYTIYESAANETLGTVIYTITQQQLAYYNVTGLTANTTYYFTVRIYDSDGLYSDSNQVAGTTATHATPPPPAPEAPFPWIPVAIGLVVTAVVVAIVVVAIRKKRSKPKTTA